MSNKTNPHTLVRLQELELKKLLLSIQESVLLDTGNITT
jgi:hypothetical protein